MIEAIINTAEALEYSGRQRSAEEARLVAEVRAQVRRKWGDRIKALNNAVEAQREARRDYVIARIEGDPKGSFVVSLGGKWYHARRARPGSRSDEDVMLGRRSAPAGHVSRSVNIAIHSAHAWPDNESRWSRTNVEVKKGWKWKPRSPWALAVAFDAIVFPEELRALMATPVRPRKLVVGRTGDKAWLCPALQTTMYPLPSNAVRADGPAVLTNNTKFWDRTYGDHGLCQAQHWFKPAGRIGPAALLPEGLPGLGIPGPGV